MGKSYSEKLKDPRWQKFRLKIFERDQFACRECNSDEETLHAHHIFYLKDKDPWDYPSYAVVTLCEECHKEAHTNESKKERNNFIEELKSVVNTYCLNCEISEITSLVQSIVSNEDLIKNLHFILKALNEPHVYSFFISSYLRNNTIQRVDFQNIKLLISSKKENLES